jgi:hypothetical protein
MKTAEVEDASEPSPKEQGATQGGMKHKLYNVDR